jgi:hypothetical protein
MLWRDIPGYEGQYEISNTGVVRNWVTWRILKPRQNWEGSHLVNLASGGVHKTYSIHRLVAQVFVDQPVGKRFVKHKDGNKDNNAWDNLYWTHSKRPVKERIPL